MVVNINMKKISLIFLILASINSNIINAQQLTNAASIQSKMNWYEDAKLGIFIHWGIYSVKGIDESWSFHNKKISWSAYMAQLKGFTASKYNPEQWADVIQATGAQYAVVTTKHHDGVALWHTKEHHYSVVDSTPAKRDLISPLFNALRKRNIKAGAYYSLIDWSHPDYPGFLNDSSRYQIKNDSARWKRFTQFNNNQIAEVSQLLHPDLWWFDGDWEHSAAEWNAPLIRNNILKNNPSTIINGRLQGYGDYETPEQNIPVSRPKYPWWELCMTINNNWGFQPQDTAWKTPYEIITIFTDVISNGGNLLLDIGPKEDGTIPPQQLYVLKELGNWNKSNAAAIFGTKAGIPPGHFYGATTLSKDSTKLYLFVAGNTNAPLLLKGLDNKINQIKILGSGKILQHKVVGKISWSPVPGLVYIDVPQGSNTKYMTVLELSLDKPVKLYRGKGGFD